MGNGGLPLRVGAKGLLHSEIVKGVKSEEGVERSEAKVRARAAGVVPGHAQVRLKMACN